VISWANNASQTLMPGDTLITRCVFDSSKRDKVTKFGPSSYDEMCFNFMLYYPAQPVFDMCVGFGEDVPLAACSTAEKLGAVIGRSGVNQTVVMQLMASGDLFPATKKVEFTEYNASAGCGQRAAASGAGTPESSAGGGSSSGSGGNLTVSGTRNAAQSAGTGLALAAVTALAALLL
jgi:hypothetical protein